jgi:hypothetical protein
MTAIDLIGGVRQIGTRFALIGVLPLAIFGFFVLALLWSGAPGEEPHPDHVLDRAREIDAWEGGLMVLGIVLAAIIAQPFQLALVRLLEGYWGERAGSFLMRFGRWLQDRRLSAIEKQLTGTKTREEALGRVGQELERRRLFPERSDGLLPTQLGNALRAAERRAGALYGLDAIVVWPRLYPLLTEPIRKLVDDRRDQLDLTARLTVVFLAAAIVSLGLLACHRWWLLVPAVCLALAWLAYRGAVAAAVGYGEGLQAAVELHRFDFLRALHLPLPLTRNEEIASNQRLMQLMRQGEEVDLSYDHQPADRA